MRKFKMATRASHLLASVMAAALLGACSSDVTRFGDDPFQNPYSSRAAFDPVTTNSINRGKATARGPIPAAPLPSASAALQPDARVTTQKLPSPNQPILGANPALTTGSVGGSNYPALTARAAAPSIQPAGTAGWSAIGGTPVTLQKGENLNALSQRYNVPVNAIMAVNGLSRVDQAAPGQQVMIPAYNAVRATGPMPRPAASAPQAAAVIQRAPVPAVQKLPRADTRSAAILPPTPPRNIAPRIVAPRIVAPRVVTSNARDVAPRPVSDAEKRAAAKLREMKATRPSVAPDSRALAAEKKASAEKKAAALKARRLAETQKAAKLAAARKARVADDALTTASVTPPKPEPRLAFAPTQAMPKAEAPRSETPQADTGSFRWPAKGRVISGFGARGTGGANDGINIAVPEGTPVRAAEGGTVVHADDALKGYGKLVLIRHPSGYVSVYAHNGELNVKRGESVKRGQVIARAGQTGNVTTPQVHFELRKGSTPVDPTKYLGE